MTDDQKYKALKRYFGLFHKTIVTKSMGYKNVNSYNGITAQRRKLARARFVFTAELFITKDLLEKIYTNDGRKSVSESEESNDNSC
jgi:hypothetical protein